MCSDIRIRLRFSSVVNYLAIVYRMLVSVGFAVVIARKLRVEEFGLWGIIWSTSFMLSSLAGLWVFWAQRFIARGDRRAFATSLSLCLLYWIVGGLIYVGVSFFEDSVLGWGLEYLLWGLPLFWLYVIDLFVNGVSTVVKPEVIGFKRFMYETLRIVFVFVFVVLLRWGLLGVIIGVELAALVGIVFGLFLIRGTGVVGYGFSSRLVVEWFKGFHVPLLNVLYGFLRSGIRVVVSWVSGSSVPVAYLNVGFASLMPVTGVAGAVTPALYARILRGGKGSDVEEVLRIFFLLNGFMVSVFVFFSRSIASLYNPLYVDAWIIVVLMSLFAFVDGLVNVFMMTVMGASRVDEEGMLCFSEIVSSYLFKAPLMRLLSLIASYIIGLSLVFLLGENNYLFDALAFAISLLLGSLVFLYWFYSTAKSSIPFNMPLREVFIAILASLAMGSYCMIAGVHNIIIRGFWSDTPILARHLVVAGAIYLALWYTLSPWLRKLVGTTLNIILRHK